jgi:diguanylate cyclase (GGDEF)-like protein
MPAMTSPSDQVDAATVVTPKRRLWSRALRSVPIWLAWLVGGLALCLPYLMLAADLQTVVYEGVAIATPIAIGLGIYRYRPTQRAWYLVGVGAALMAAGELTWMLDAEDGVSGLADTLFLLGYVALCAAMVGFARRHSAGIGSILDASILTAAAASILWMVVIGPLLADTSQAPAAALVATMYPLADIVMIGLLLRILLDRTGSNPALLLFAAGVGAFLVSDLIYSVLAVQGTYTSGAVDLGWILGYVLWGAAALHPSMAAEATRVPGDGRITNRRLAALALVSLVPVTIAAAEQLRHGAVEPMPAILASAVMFVLVIARLSGVVRSQRSLIDERTRMQGALERLSVEDALTGLSNRRGFYSRLADALDRDPFAVAVAYIDLDDFKVINDSMGHPTGDLVLQAIATRLRGQVRSRDTVARLGGDEFAVLMTDCAGPEPALNLATRLSAVIEEPIQIDGVGLRTHGSFGIAVSGPSGSDAVSLMRDADVALYRAKARSDGAIEVYDEDLHREAVRTMVIRNDLARAIERSQLRLEYQPIVDLATSRPVAFEALLRWDHPELGLLQPDEFLPVAERGGQMVAIGRWAIAEACRAAAGWQTTGYAAAVNVNLSPGQLRDASLPADVRTALDDAGLAAHWLVLEVTESVLDLALDVRFRLDQLRDWGVGLSIDDFGTGYSSLARVGELPVRELKIDRSLLLGDQRMLSAVLQFGTSLGLRVVMEGVETTRQLELVRRLGFAAAQGFALAPPMRSAAVAPWLIDASDAGGTQPRMRFAPAT